MPQRCEDFFHVCQGLVACVSDSFDVFKACREYWGDALKEKIKGRISRKLSQECSLLEDENNDDNDGEDDDDDDSDGDSGDGWCSIFSDSY